MRSLPATIVWGLFYFMADQQYIKEYSVGIAFHLYLYGSDGEPIRRVKFGQDLMDLLKSGAKYVQQDNTLVDNPTIEMMELEIAEIRSHLRLLEKSINEGHR